MKLSGEPPGCDRPASSRSGAEAAHLAVKISLSSTHLLLALALAVWSAECQLVMPPPPPPPPPMTLVPGSPMGKLERDQLVTQIIFPSDFYAKSLTGNASLDLANSYVIDHKRYVESVSSRCFSSTLLEDPDSVAPSFILIGPEGEVRLNATAPAELVRAAGFEPAKRTTVFIHGFTQSYPETSWLRRTRALFEMNAKIHKQNLIIMDWGKASHGSYAQVAAKTSAMGSFLANFLGKLFELGAERLSVHLVGHSLGAHVAGFAGKRTRPRLGRITALDPAGPCFGKIFSNSPTDRLSADDAYEVDVYHYDDDFLGLPGQHGQFDVYVNGGSSQPGCKDNMNSMFQALLTMVFRRNRVLSESHTRSTEVSTAQLAADGCQEVAYECRDYASFTAGECGRCDDQNSQCFFMGFGHQYADLDALPLRTSFPGRRFYIATGSAEHYCLHHYQLLVRFEPQAELGAAAKRNKWRLQAELLNDSQGRVNITLTNQMAPHIFSYLLTTDSARPARIVAAGVQLRSPEGSVVALAAANSAQRPAHLAPKAPAGFRLLAVEVNFMSSVSPQVRRALSSRLCPAATNWQRPDANAIADSASLDSVQLDECGPPGELMIRRL